MTSPADAAHVTTSQPQGEGHYATSPTIVAGAALAVLLAALSATPSLAQASSATTGAHRRIVDLGALGRPQNQSEATAISARGEVVGWSTLVSVVGVV